MKDYLKSLRTQAWRTAGARYNAARRLKRRELFSTVSLAMFATLSVAVAFVHRIYVTQTGSALDNYLTALSVCLGVFLLAISLMEWGAANGAKADALHRNAEDINAFQIKLAQRLAQLESGANLNWVDVDGLREEYDLIKDRCLYNHEPVDDKLFRAVQRRAEEFTGSNRLPEMATWDSFLAAAQWHLSSIWYFAIFWFIVASSVVFAFSVAN